MRETSVPVSLYLAVPQYVANRPPGMCLSSLTAATKMPLDCNINPFH